LPEPIRRRSQRRKLRHGLNHITIVMFVVSRLMHNEVPPQYSRRLRFFPISVFEVAHINFQRKVLRHSARRGG
jgi:hypothetical protein